MANPACLRDLALLALTSTAAQFFIYFTLDNFGPVLFSMVMASRQLFSLVLSAVLFGASPVVCLPVCLPRHPNLGRQLSLCILLPNWRPGLASRGTNAGHALSAQSAAGAVVVFGVMAWKIRQRARKAGSGGGSSGGGSKPAAVEDAKKVQ
eukprot:SAG22_NODE_664_length_8022_cov_2.639576_3_plen_151_part_00